MRPAAAAVPPAAPIRHPQLDSLAGRLAGLGAALGILAGVVDIAVGASIPSWTGNKLNPTPLALLTVGLSAIALAGAIRWMRPGGRESDRRLATLLAFVIPAAICFTTIGRLWYPPGLLLLVAGGLVVRTSSHGELSHALSRRHWGNGLVALLGAYYLVLGGDALPKAAGVLGLLGALAIWAALLTSGSSYRLRLGLLGLGALPFAIATWWSVVTPLIALLLLTLGHAALRSQVVEPGGTPAAREH